MFVFDFREELDGPVCDTRQAIIERGLPLRNVEEAGFMQVGVGDLADIHGIVAEIDNPPADHVVLMFVVAPDRPAENLVHEQAAVFARSGKIGWRARLALGRQLAPFAKYEHLGLAEARVGIGELRLPVYGPVCHLSILS